MADKIETGIRYSGSDIVPAYKYGGEGTGTIIGLWENSLDLTYYKDLVDCDKFNVMSNGNDSKKTAIALPTSYLPWHANQDIATGFIHGQDKTNPEHRGFKTLQPGCDPRFLGTADNKFFLFTRKSIDNIGDHIIFNNGPVNMTEVTNSSGLIWFGVTKQSDEEYFWITTDAPTATSRKLLKYYANSFREGRLPQRLVVCLQGAGGGGGGSVGAVGGCDGCGAGSGAFGCVIINVADYDWRIEVGKGGDGGWDGSHKNKHNGANGGDTKLAYCKKIGASTSWEYVANANGGSYGTYDTESTGGAGGDWVIPPNYSDYETNGICWIIAGIKGSKGGKNGKGTDMGSKIINLKNKTISNPGTSYDSEKDYCLYIEGKVSPKAASGGGQFSGSGGASLFSTGGRGGSATSSWREQETAIGFGGGGGGGRYVFVGGYPGGTGSDGCAFLFY